MMSDQRRECHAQGAGGDPASGGHGPARTVRRVRAATVTATTPVPGDLEPLDRPAPQRTRGARLNLPVGAGRATAGTASTPAKQCVVTDRILRPPSFASPRRSPRASPCLTCLDTENALRPGNTPDPGEITFAIRLTNSGETGYAPATFTDSLTGVVDDASYGDDATATVGTLQY